MPKETAIIDFTPIMMGLPLNKMLPFVNALLQDVSLEHLGATASEFGMEVDFSMELEEAPRDGK